MVAEDKIDTGLDQIIVMSSNQPPHSQHRIEEVEWEYNNDNPPGESVQLQQRNYPQRNMLDAVQRSHQHKSNTDLTWMEYLQIN